LCISEQTRHLLRPISQASKTAYKHYSSSCQHSPQTLPIDANVECHPWLPLVATGGNPILEMMEPNRSPTMIILPSHLETSFINTWQSLQILRFMILIHFPSTTRIIANVIASFSLCYFLLLTSKILEHKFYLRDITECIDSSNQPV
jgi:hypothetical protein